MNDHEEKRKQWLEKHLWPIIEEQSRALMPKIINLPPLELFYYCKHGEFFLDKLYNALINASAISTNEKFKESFRDKEVFEKNRTNWFWSEPQCYYLLYLLYGKKETHKNDELHIVAKRLFKFSEIPDKRIGRNYSVFLKNLKKISYLERPSMRKISDIYNSLNFPNTSKT